MTFQQLGLRDGTMRAGVCELLYGNTQAGDTIIPSIPMIQLFMGETQKLLCSIFLKKDMVLYQSSMIPNDAKSINDCCNFLQQLQRAVKTFLLYQGNGIVSFSGPETPNRHLYPSIADDKNTLLNDIDPKLQTVFKDMDYSRKDLSGADDKIISNPTKILIKDLACFLDPFFNFVHPHMEQRIYVKSSLEGTVFFVPGGMQNYKYVSAYKNQPFLLAKPIVHGALWKLHSTISKNLKSHHTPEFIARIYSMFEACRLYLGEKDTTTGINQELVFSLSSIFMNNVPQDEWDSHITVLNQFLQSYPNSESNILKNERNPFTTAPRVDLNLELEKSEQIINNNFFYTIPKLELRKFEEIEKYIVYSQDKKDSYSRINNTNTGLAILPSGFRNTIPIQKIFSLEDFHVNKILDHTRDLYHRASRTVEKRTNPLHIPLIRSAQKQREIERDLSNSLLKENKILSKLKGKNYIVSYIETEDFIKKEDIKLPSINNKNNKK